MLQKLGCPTLEQRRQISKAILLYKILNNLVAIPADRYTTPNNNCTRGHPQISNGQAKEYGPVQFVQKNT